MATELLVERSGDVAVRQLALVWQDPISHAFIKVARLHELTSGMYVFEYTEGAGVEGFFPLAQFPNVEAVYTSGALPAFFANRVMSRERVSYADFRGWLGLAESGADTPIEVLARTGGPRATDTFHVVDEPLVAHGAYEARFFASGVRHIEGAGKRLARLRPGDRLQLRAEPSNPADENALLIDVAANEPVGWVPAWLLPDVSALSRSGRKVHLTVEQVNPRAPSHLQLLCRLTVR